MRKIITTPTELAFSHQVSNERYYGVMNQVSNDKGFITKTDYHNGRYIIPVCDNITKGNAFCLDQSPKSLQNVVEDLISKGFEVYEFDNYTELFLWVIEKSP